MALTTSATWNLKAPSKHWSFSCDPKRCSTEPDSRTATDQWKNFLVSLRDQFLNNTVFFVPSAFSFLCFYLLIFPARKTLDSSFLLCLLLQLKHQKLELGRFFCSPLAPLHFPLKRNVISPGGEVWECNLGLCLLRGRYCWKVCERYGLLQIRQCCMYSSFKMSLIAV